ncbi:hypothetical protein BGZ76_000123 [Entomortierella beljakovae]|nr:hypothetical protein BGZ76_000123 [Entomortierella beljakovae]
MFKLFCIALTIIITTVASAFPLSSCVPGVTVKEYHPFYLRSSKLDSMVSKMVDDNLLVGGVNGNKNFAQLEFCIVSSDHGCDRKIPANCIYENVEYRFRVTRPMQGYLRVAGDMIDIVDDFYEGTELNLFQEEGWGLRIAHSREDQSRTVFATNGGGKPITMENFKHNDDRQWFQIIDTEEEVYPKHYWRENFYDRERFNL